MQTESLPRTILCPGFKQAWQTGNYQTIVNVAEKIPTTILEEDPKLLMWYNMAATRLGGE